MGSGLAPAPQLSPGHSLLPAQPQQLRPPWGLRNVPCSSLSLEGPPPTPHLCREHLLAGPWSSSCLLVPPPFPDSPRSPAFAPPATLRFTHLGVCLLSGGWQRWSLNSLCPHDPTHIDKGNHGDTYRGRGRVTAAGRSVSAASVFIPVGMRSGHRHKGPQMRWRKQQEFVSSFLAVRGLEVRDQGVSRAGFSRGLSACLLCPLRPHAVAPLRASGPYLLFS